MKGLAKILLKELLSALVLIKMLNNGIKETIKIDEWIIDLSNQQKIKERKICSVSSPTKQKRY